jgi:hypothetical protein
MAIDFSKNGSWTLKPVSSDLVKNDLKDMLASGETLLLTAQAAREFVVFTGKRVMVLDVQGITGSRKSITSLPYSKVQYFSVRTPGFGELIPESELQLVFFGGYTAKFAFKGNIDIEKLTAAVAAQVL